MLIVCIFVGLNKTVKTNFFDMNILNSTHYQRKETQTVQIGNIAIGGNHNIAVQTMTNTPTAQVKETVEQVITAYKAGAHIVRITVPSKKNIEHLKEIKQSLTDLGYPVPLVADIHFNQQIALEAAKIVEKVRINPGNFADSKNFHKIDYTEEEYLQELKKIKEAFVPLLDVCKEYNTTLRVGSNHGSLSDRIMSRYGDTPEGMAESAMEFLRICKDENFNDVVISMKASNTRIMVQATRLLVYKMDMEDMHFPLHIGVTEAGEGEDGRIKSAVGVGALLMDGIGDTIRISLTEPPENEVPVALKFVDYIQEKFDHEPIESNGALPIDPFNFKRRSTTPIQNIGGNYVPIVISSKDVAMEDKNLNPDYFLTDDSSEHALFKYIQTKEVTPSFLETIKNGSNKVWILSSDSKNPFIDFRNAIFRMMNSGVQNPVILHKAYNEHNLESLQVKSSTDLGGLFLDGLADGIWIENSDDHILQEEVISTAFGILQASRMRITRPEYISCPSCGRTMFDIQSTTQRIRQKTAHLRGLKIGIMGCVVNGLGEMADADYGYVGFGSGKINLYYNKELIKRGIPEDLAVDELISLIKEKGDWSEPS